ncbi:MAG: zf-HC2 domain-containing protein [Candidatus Tantalella remota]|nr:zf-HC2 domain-containing protein [Candidatus Tantalella remota]
MRCKKIRELILTDHIDGELSGDISEKIEKHLASCPGCRKVKEEAMDIAASLRSSARIDPPETLWKGIKEAIEEGRIPHENDLLSGIRDFLVVRRPVLVSAAAAFAIAAVVLLKSYVYDPLVLNTYMEQQMDFLDYLDNGNGGADGDTGIPFEDLFL